MRYFVLLYSLLALLPLSAQSHKGDVVQCPVVKVEAERLGDLNVPRTGLLLNVNGEPTVFGGHTTNYVPTATIEYYKDGKWNLLSSAFTHDNGFAVQLTSGKVLIGGGHERNLGIGQSYEVELYDPQTHTCEGFGSLDTKRAVASALALDDGSAIITGNWYHDDAIEIYDGNGGFVPVKGVSCNRAIPYILRTAKDDAIIFSSMDSKGVHTPHPLIDRLHGEAYREPLLEEWGLLMGYEQSPSNAFIGDEAKGDYSYLMIIENEVGQTAIARITNGQFSLLDTDVPIPMSCQWGRIAYTSFIFADRQNKRAYLLGTDTLQYQKPGDTGRIYVITIDYAHLPAHLTFGYTDVLSDYDIRKAIMTTDGDLMLAGGNPTENNFKPTSATWLLHVSPRAQKAGIGHLPLWGWALIILAIVALAGLMALLYYRRKRKQPNKEMPVTAAEEKPVVPVLDEAPEEAFQETDEVNKAELMQRICQVMEEQSLYLNPELKVADIAAILGTNRNVISSCINSQGDISFPQFVNTYRVERAKELLLNQPDLKIAEVWMSAGFSSEASFYRIFKAATGATPNEWRDNTSNTHLQTT